jgi:hypothetical protein
VTVATRRPPPTSYAGSFTMAPAAVTSARLRLEIRHVPVGHRRGHALRSAARHQPDVLALGLEADVVGPVGLRQDAGLNESDAVPGHFEEPSPARFWRSGLGGAASHLGGLALCGSVPRLRSN